MARSASKHPTDAELDILKVLWAIDGPRSVREVRDALTALAGPRAQPRAYTSIMTLMTIMYRKRYLRRRKGADGGYLYTAAVSEHDTRRGMLRDLIDRAFRGSSLAAMLHLLDERELDERELLQLRAMVDRHRRKGT